MKALSAFIEECGLPTKMSQLKSRVEITPAVLRQVADIRSADISHNLPENCPPERRKMFSDFMGRIQAGSMIAILLWWLEQEEPLHTGQMKRYIRDFFEVIESYEFPMDTFPSKPPSQEQK